jgi:Zn-dependent protease
MFNPFFLIFSLPIILIAITIHEFAHGYVADALGDPTPRASGRLSLNPLAHLDPIGFFMLILVRFGWAKPVPINPRYFENPRQGMALVGLAGPAANFFFAWTLSIIFFKLLVIPFGIFYEIIDYAIWLNLALGVFNLIPIPPLDGSRILAGILPEEQSEALANLEPYGFAILIFILFFPQTNRLIIFGVNFLYNLII